MKSSGNQWTQNKVQNSLCSAWANVGGEDTILILSWVSCLFVSCDPNSFRTARQEVEPLRHFPLRPLGNPLPMWRFHESCLGFLEHHTPSHFHTHTHTSTTRKNKYPRRSDSACASFSFRDLPGYLLRCMGMFSSRMRLFSASPLLRLDFCHLPPWEVGCTFFFFLQSEAIFFHSSSIFSLTRPE